MNVMTNDARSTGVTVHVNGTVYRSIRHTMCPICGHDGVPVDVMTGEGHLESAYIANCLCGARLNAGRWEK